MFVRTRLAWGGVACALLAAPLPAKPVSPPSVGGYVGPVLAATADDDDSRVAEAQFDSTTAPLPLNVASLGYHATATSEFGDLVHLSGNTHFIASLTVTMSSWAIRSDYPGGGPFGFSHPITLTLYAVDRSQGEPRPGVGAVGDDQKALAGDVVEVEGEGRVFGIRRVDLEGDGGGLVLVADRVAAGGAEVRSGRVLVPAVGADVPSRQGAPLQLSMSDR